MERKSEILIPGTLHPFRVPNGYFEQLPDSILSHIHGEEKELATVAPLLYSAARKMAYSTPAGYFDKEISIPAAEKTPAKIVALKGYRRILQYVAAAMLAGILVSGAFIFTDSKNNFKPEKDVSVKSALPYSGDTSAASETAIATPSFDKRVESLSDDELQNYLEENAPPEPIQILEEDAGI